MGQIARLSRMAFGLAAKGMESHHGNRPKTDSKPAQVIAWRSLLSGSKCEDSPDNAEPNRRIVVIGSTLKLKINLRLIRNGHDPGLLTFGGARQHQAQNESGGLHTHKRT